MMTVAIMTVGAIAYVWQRNPANKALACGRGAAAAGWIQQKLSKIAQSCLHSAASVRKGPEKDLQGATILPCAPPVEAAFAANDVLRSWVALYQLPRD